MILKRLTFLLLKTVASGTAAGGGQALLSCWRWHRCSCSFLGFQHQGLFGLSLDLAASREVTCYHMFPCSSSFPVAAHSPHSTHTKALLSLPPASCPTPLLLVCAIPAETGRPLYVHAAHPDAWGLLVILTLSFFMAARGRGRLQGMTWCHVCPCRPHCCVPAQNGGSQRASSRASRAESQPTNGWFTHPDDSENQNEQMQVRQQLPTPQTPHRRWSQVDAGTGMKEGEAHRARDRQRGLGACAEAAAPAPGRATSCSQNPGSCCARPRCSPAQSHGDET